LSRKTARYSAARVNADFAFDIAAGRVAGWSHVNKFGHNSDVDVGSEDVWEVGGDYTGFIVNASTLEIFSSDVNDTAAGSGARSVKVFGLDSDYIEQEEIITLAGAGTVVSVNPYLRVHRVYVMSGGVNGENAGIITIQDTQPVTLASIGIGDNQTHQATFTVPVGKVGIITQIWAGLGVGTGVAAETDIAMLVRPLNEVFQTKFLLGLTTHWSHPPRPPIVVLAKADIKLRAVNNDSINSNITGGFDIILRDI